MHNKHVISDDHKFKGEKMNLIKKISIKTVIGNVQQGIMRQEIKPGNLMRIVGVASGVKTGVSDYGDWLALTGQFKATNLLTNEQYTSGKAFLPDEASDLIAGAVRGEDSQAVEFAFDIGVKLDESSATGYVYTVTPLMEMGGDDPLARIESSLKALDAPKDTKEKAKK